MDSGRFSGRTDDTGETNRSAHWRAAVALFREPIAEGRCLRVDGYEIQVLEDTKDRYKVVAPREEVVDVFQLPAFVSARHLAQYLEWAISNDREGPADRAQAGERPDPLGFH